MNTPPDGASNVLLPHETPPRPGVADTHVIHRDTPAQEWVEALALGNGLLGVMAFGSARDGSPGERLQVNHTGAWSGPAGHRPPLPGSAEDNVRALAAARAAVDAGDVRLAESHLRRTQADHSQAYLPFVDLDVRVRPTDAQDVAHPAHVEDGRDGQVDDGERYARWLCLRTARAGHVRTPPGAHGPLVHSTWAPRGEEVVVHTVRNTTGADVDVTLALTSRLRTRRASAPAGGPALVVELPVDVAPTHEDVEDHVRYDAARGRVAAAVLAVVVEDDASRTAPSVPAPQVPAPGGTDGAAVGHRLPHGHRLVVVLAAGTTPGLGDDGTVDGLLQSLHDRAARVATEGSATSHARHAAAHRALYDRTELTLHEPDGEHDAGGRDAGDAPEAATAERTALAFHFGRYVLVSGYHPDANPLSLQGLWNDELPAPWSSNYTLNINTEMNYWPAETANLAECHEPLLRWLARTAAGPARDAARHLYGADGWVLHHNSDAWGHAATVGAGDGDVSWAWWPLGGVWLARHLWDHHEFSGDVEQLEDAWPVLASCARFVADWLVPDPSRGPGATRTVPSTSPENRFVAPDGEPAAVSASSTMDVALVRDLVLRVRQAADVLGVAPGWLPALERDAAGLPDPRVGPRGELLEWAEPLEEAEPEHRHTSHLVGVHPLGQIGPDTQPALAAAARRTLELRGPESTGWALAWRLALWARLRDGEQAYETLGRCLRPALQVGGEAGPAHRGGLYPNLFSAHPPFQIDGNLGLVAGIVEMLLQSHEGRIDLLPALPSAWAAGSVRGLRARGGVVVDVEWAAGAPTRVRLVAARPRRTEVRWHGRTATVDLAGGTPVLLGPDLEPWTTAEH